MIWTSHRRDLKNEKEKSSEIKQLKKLIKNNLLSILVNKHKARILFSALLLFDIRTHVFQIELLVEELLLTNEIQNFWLKIGVAIANKLWE